MSTKDEFEIAFLNTKKKYDFINRKSGRIFISTFEDRLAQSRRKGFSNTFKSDLDATVKQFNLRGDERSAYRSLVGSYFGSRGGKKSKNSKKNLEVNKQKELFADMETARKERNEDID